jgi:hypothetical protein
MNHLPIVALLLVSSTSFALPPGAPAKYRQGANHHAGDDGFVAKLGRRPSAGEEQLRMREHLLAIRAKLGASKATKPELEPVRARLLAHLDDYIAKGTTPKNEHLRWRTPVFIDDHGTICAVGYLIEKSVGRAVAESIASTHRYRYLEEIAADLPAVRAWIEQSGFTLDELASIQPGYMGPDVLQWKPERFAEYDHETNKPKRPPNGTYSKDGTVGAFKNGLMEGTWTKTVDERVRGKGTFSRGRGTWTSYADNGAKLAEGDFVRNRPSGTWRFFHKSGHLAAEGSFSNGQRVGSWRFYYDDAKKTPIASGRFTSRGYVTGTWKHFDARGKLLAMTAVDTPEPWRNRRAMFWNVGYRIDVTTGPDRIRHQIHQGSIDAVEARLDKLELDGERVYVQGERIYDANGRQLVAIGDGWRADDCRWSATRKKFARRGDVSALNALIHADEDVACTTGARIPAARARKIGALVTSMKQVRSAAPAFMTEIALGEEEAPQQDLPDVLAGSMSLDITWPHVDGRFIKVFETLPGYDMLF